MGGLVEWAKGDAEGCGKSLQAFKQSISVFEALDKTQSALDDYTFVLPQGEEREKRSLLARETVVKALKNTIVCKDVAEGRIGRCTTSWCLTTRLPFQKESRPCSLS